MQNETAGYGDHYSPMDRSTLVLLGDKLEVELMGCLIVSLRDAKHLYDLNT